MAWLIPIIVFIMISLLFQPNKPPVVVNKKKLIAARIATAKAILREKENGSTN